MSAGAPQIAALEAAAKAPSRQVPRRRVIELDADCRITGAVDAPA